MVLGKSLNWDVIGFINSISICVDIQMFEFENDNVLTSLNVMKSSVNQSFSWVWS